MNNIGQTAIDWLVEQLTKVERKNWINNKILSIGKNTLAKVTFDEIVQQAKEMEKQQKEVDYQSGFLDCYTKIMNERLTRDV